MKKKILVSIAVLFPSLMQGKPVMETFPCKPALPDTAIVKMAWKGASSRSEVELPLAVDHSTSRYFPSIINQKGGSCAQASGIGYLFTYEMNRYLDRPAKDSDANVFSYLFTWNFLNGGNDEGGFVDQGLNIAIKYGVMTEEDYGYASAYQFKWASGYEKYLKAMRYRGKELYEFSVTDEAGLHQVKQYLASKNDGKEGGGVLTFSCMSSGWKIDNDYQGPSKTGYHSLLTRLATEGSHALTIAGYDDTVEYTDDEGKVHRGAFIVVNSWGTAMHDRGRFYLPYYFFLHRGPVFQESQLSTKMTGIDVHTHEPKLVFKIAMDYSSRNDIAVVCGASNKADSSYPEERYTPLVFFNQGGDYPLQGAYNNRGPLEFAIDYTEQLPSEDYLHSKYFLNVVRSQRGSVEGEGKVLGFSVIDYRTPGAPREYVYPNPEQVELKWGNNLFGLSTLPLFKVSANLNRWRNADGSIETEKTYVLRTRTGKFAKIRTVGYDPKTGQVTLQYFYQQDGTRNLKKEE